MQEENDKKDHKEQPEDPAGIPESSEHEEQNEAAEIPAPKSGSEELLDNLSPRMTPVKAAIIGLLSGFLVFQVFTALLSALIIGTDLDKADPNVLRLMQTAGQILFMLLPALILSKLLYENVTELLRVRLPDKKGFLMFILAMVFLIMFLQNFMVVQTYYVERFFEAYPSLGWLEDTMKSLDKAVESAYLTFFTTEGFLDYVIIIMVVAVVPAVAEEVMFRGYIQRSFELRFHPLLAAAITAFFFSIFHVNPSGIIGLFMIGLFLGFAAYKADSLLVPVALHFINNLSAVLLIFVYGNEELVSSGEKISAQTFEFSMKNSIYMGALFVATIFAIHIYYKKLGNEKAD